MRYRILSPLAGGILGLLFGSTHVPVASADAPRVEVPEMKGLVIETRGMVHEAFAQPFDLQPEPGPVVPKEPPPPVPELPPAQRPEGDNVQFLPGYWAWDADRNDFLWVSGIYRNAPPGRQYVAGYWTQTPEGWRWVQGFWAGANQQQVPYTPEPPATLDNGPSLPPADANQFYVPGTWIFRQPQSVWRPGFWSPRIAGRIWVPAHYVWTPAGFIFVEGYWDCPLEDRGLLFAPVYFTDALYRQPGWCYTPSVVINIAPLFDCLFVRHRAYYFGDYCGPRYAGLGYAPWFGGYRYDPLFSYYRWHHRGNPNWAGGLRQAYADRAAGRLAAPPRTFAQQTVVARQGGTAPLLATPLAQAGNTVRLTQVNQTQLVTQKTNIQRVRDVAQTRVQVESNVAKNGIGTPKALPLSRPSDVPLVSGGTNLRSQVLSQGGTANTASNGALDSKNIQSVQSKNRPLQVPAGSTSAAPQANGGSATNTQKLG